MASLTATSIGRHPLSPMQGAWTGAAARDRMSSAVFLAALIHGVVILGVTFTSGVPQRDPAATSLEVVLVTRDYEKISAPASSVLLARQNLIGRGNAARDEQLRTALARDEVLAPPGPDQDGDPATNALSQGKNAVTRLTGSASTQARVLSEERGEANAPGARRLLPPGESAAVEILAEPEHVTRIPDEQPRELLVSANTRESRIAGYLNAWKNKVERIGTLNFPRSAELSRMNTYPVLEVAISASGDLKDVVVRSSSGHRNLDQAAMDILRMAAPFEPFPQGLRDEYDVLRFAYEWHFGQGTGIGRVKTLHGS